MGANMDAPTAPDFNKYLAGCSAPLITTVTATAGNVYGHAVEVPHTVTAEGICVFNFGTVNGNAQVGIYGPMTTDGTLLDLPLLASSADTVLSGTTQYQKIMFTSPVTLQKGIYYCFVLYSSNTHTFGRVSQIGYKTGYNKIWANVGGYAAGLPNPAPAGSNNDYARCCTLVVSGLA